MTKALNSSSPATAPVGDVALNLQPLPLVERALTRRGFTMRKVRDNSGLNYRTLRKRLDDPSQLVMSDFGWLSKALGLSPLEVFELVQDGIKEAAISHS